MSIRKEDIEVLRAFLYGDDAQGIEPLEGLVASERGALTRVYELLSDKKEAKLHRSPVNGDWFGEAELEAEQAGLDAGG